MLESISNKNSLELKGKERNVSSAVEDSSEEEDDWTVFQTNDIMFLFLFGSVLTLFANIWNKKKEVSQ